MIQKICRFIDYLLWLKESGVVFLWGMLFWGCDASPELSLDERVPAIFISSLGELDAGDTRVLNQTWYTTDVVGVAMAGTGVIDTGYKQYKPSTSSTSVTLNPSTSDQTLYYPVNGNTVTFTAFCPYQAPSSGVVAYSTFGDQSTSAKMQAVDLIYHTGGTGSNSSPTAALEFTHKFSKLTINVTRGANVSDALTSLAMTVTGVPTKATCTLAGGAVAVSTASTITPFHENVAAAGKATVIVPPHNGTSYTGRTITFKVGSLNYSYTIPNTFNFTAGNEYIFNFTLTQTAPILSGTSITAWTGGTIAWDGAGNILTAPAEVTHYKSASVGNEIIIKTNHTDTPGIQYSTSATSVIGSATVSAYLTEVTLTKTKATTPYEWTLSYKLLENTDISSRIAYIHASIGGMTTVIKLIQSTAIEPVTILNGDANCFIVAPGTKIRFPVTRAISSGGASSSATFTAEKLWDDTGAVESVTVNDTGTAATFTVTATAIPGNAVIAVKVGTTIYWSYHIWVTDYDPNADGATFTNAFTSGGTEYSYTLMDRNLGATFAGTGSGLGTGLFYQWGRKDPFPATDVLTTGSFSKVLTSETNGTVANTIKNPNVFYYAATGAYNWLYASYNSSLWGNNTTKTIYDPCPVGWRVASMGTGFSTSPWAGFSTTNGGTFNSGYNWGTNAIYPTSGYRSSASGGRVTVGTGRIWTRSVYLDGGYEYPRLFEYSVDAIKSAYTYAASGFSVRCSKE